MNATTDRQVGLGVEGTYGTYQAPTIFTMPKSADIIEDPPVAYDFGGLRAGFLGASEDDIAFGPRVGGRFVMRGAVVTKGGGFETLLEHALGASQESGTNPLTDVVTQGALDGLSMTCQVVKPWIPGTAGETVLSGLGGKITMLRLTCEQGQPMMYDVEMDLSQVVDSESKAAASYTLGEPLLPHLTTLTVNSSAVRVRGWTLEIRNPLNVDRVALAAAGVKSEPVEQGRREYTVTLRGIEFTDQTHYDRIVAVTKANRVKALSIETTAPTTSHKLTLAATKALYVASPITGLAVETFGSTQDLTLRLLQPTGGTTPLTATFVRPA